MTASHKQNYVKEMNAAAPIVASTRIKITEKAILLIKIIACIVVSAQLLSQSQLDQSIHRSRTRPIQSVEFILQEVWSVN